MSEPSSSPLSKHVRVDVSPARVARVWATVSERLEHAPTARRRWLYRGAIATAFAGLVAFGALKAMSEHQARSAWQKAALETAGDAMAVGLDDGSRLEIAAHTKVRVVGKFSETQETGATNIVDLINAGEIDIVVNTPSGGSARADGYEIRAAAVAGDKALFTTMAVLGAAVSALPVLREGFDVKSLQEYAVDRAVRA